VLDQEPNHLLENGHHLGVGQVVSVDNGQHVQELLASILPGNERRAKSKAIMPGWTR
jgi:hypothetical protein